MRFLSIHFAAFAATVSLGCFSVGEFVSGQFARAAELDTAKVETSSSVSPKLLKERGVDLAINGGQDFDGKRNADTKVEKSPEPNSNALGRRLNEEIEENSNRSESDPTKTGDEAEARSAVVAAAATDDDVSLGPSAIRPTQYKPRSPESLGSGAFAESFELNVPAFRGLEPKLALQYSSSGGLSSDGLRAGWIGVGWTLQGVPDIVRTAPVNGTPRFLSSDVYQLDGQDLIACVSGVAAPSCATGGTHVAKVEHYEKIAFEGNVWTVWDTKGVRSVFRSVSTWGSTVEAGDDNPTLIRNSYRWLLAQQIDPNGNTINYSYTCTTLPVCYPDKITYGSAEIKFISEAHPAYLTKATGRSLAKLERQLKRVEVRFASQPLKTYVLTQETSSSTNLQRLKQVQEFGRDWAVNGTAVSGNSTPPRKYVYSDSEIAYINGTQRIHTPPEKATDYKGRVFDLAGDFNGDGRQDILSIYPNEAGATNRCQFEITISTGTGFSKPTIIYPYSDKAVPCILPTPAFPSGTAVMKFDGIVADVNGDGRSDIMTYQNKKLWVYISRWAADGTISFDEHTIPYDYTVPLVSLDNMFFAADIDRDGGAEIFPRGFYANFDNSYFKFENGAFTKRVASYASGPLRTLKPYGGDLNGDGKDDLELDKLGGAGTRKQEVIQVQDDIAELLHAFTYPGREPINAQGRMDFDGDGTTEIILYSLSVPTSGHSHPIDIQPYKSNGSGMLPYGYIGDTTEFRCATWISGIVSPFPSIPTFDCIVMAGDLNGDGRAEAIFSAAPGGDVASKKISCCYVRESPIETYSDAGGGVWKKRVLPAIGIYLLADINGDGLPDIVRRRSALGANNNQANLNQPFSSGEVYYAKGPIPDFLKHVTLESGGTVDIEYKPSSEWGLTAGTRMPFVTQTVSAITEKDGRGGVARTEYSYRGGRYDFKERKFLGFAGLTAKLPCASGETACPAVDVTFSQAYAAIGKPVKIERKDGAGVVRQTVVETYAIQNTTAPYTALNTATETTLNEGGSSLVLRTERAFDAYANITQIRDFGRKDLAGDETWTLTSYAPNTTDYIVSLPRATNVRSLTNGVFSTDSDVYQKHQVFYYDSATSDATPPTKGNLTMRRSYKSVEPTSSAYSETFTYDAYGNRLSHVDGAGNRTEWDYDATYKLHVVKERAPKYFANGSLAADTRFVTSYANDNICGKPSSKTDWNGIIETYSYDVFCRPYDTVNAGTGGYSYIRYENMGNPATQAVVVYQPLATGTKSTLTRTFYDGLGRPWRKQSYADSADGIKKQSDTAYDARGNVAKITLPYFADETAQWTVNSYDWQDRVVKTVNPDASQRILTYAVQPAASVGGSTNLPAIEQRMTNEEGKVSRSYLDKDNNVILTSGNLNNAWVNEVRSYDVVGRLTGVRDHSGATWTYTYDLIGNRLTASDPDLGNWSYTYDNANRLVTQTDARGVVTTLAYDQMGRLTTKQVKGTDGVTTVLATNSYDTAASGVGAAPFHNVGLLTASTNGSATQRFSQSLTGTGTITTTRTEIDGLIQTTTDRKGKAGLTLSRSYAPGAVEVGTVASPWTYNAANMLVTIPGYVTAATYEADGQTKSITYANGVATTFTCLPQRDWLTRVTTKKGTVSLLDSQYTRDKLGRIKTIVGLTPAENWTYAYDDISRLVTATNVGDASLSETYTYSLTGNLLTRTKMGTYTYPAGNAVRPHAATSIGTKALSYDANGNMLADGSRTLTWTPANQLGMVTQSGSDVTFSYGPDGSRVKKAWAFGTTLYAGADVEIDATTVGSESYTLYPHPDIKITATASAQTAKFFLHRDHLSSVRTVTDETGAETEKTAYVSYGEPTNQAMVTKKGYIGERFDAETGLMYLNARYYDPTFGRYIPPDDGGDAEDNTLLDLPIMEPGGMTMGRGGPTGTVTAPLH